MMDTKLHDEAARLAALRRYDVLDTAAEAPFDKITSLVGMLLHVPVCLVSLVDEDRQWFKSHQGLAVCETARNVSFCDHTIRTRSPMMIEDARQDPRFRDNPLVTGPPHIASYTGIPLETPDGYNIGSLCVIDTVPRVFEPGQIDILKHCAAMVVDELELRRIARRDQLTDALTRRAFIAEADNAIARFTRFGMPSALLLLDIDHFKTVNDRYGHPVGDRVLLAVARRCMGILREGDCFARVGGEEFAVLTTEMSEPHALVLADRLRQTISTSAIDDPAGLFVTASFGVSLLVPGISNAEHWLAHADLGLYAAKRAGRNTCCLPPKIAPAADAARL